MRCRDDSGPLAVVDRCSQLLAPMTVCTEHSAIMSMSTMGTRCAGTPAQDEKSVEGVHGMLRHKGYKNVLERSMFLSPRLAGRIAPSHPPRHLAITVQHV
jgi:hypothetical protein